MAAVATTVLLILVALRIAGWDALYFVPVFHPAGQTLNNVPLLRDANWIVDASAHRDCYAKARALKRPYVLDSVVQYLEYNDSSDHKTRDVQERIIYVVVPLIDITERDHIFLEEYSGANVVDHWSGPFPEVPDGKKYFVLFSGRRGEPHTIITGATFRYSLPLSDGRQAFHNTTVVNHDQDFWYYENIDDVVCELIQVVNSNNIQIFPAVNGGKRVGAPSEDLYTQFVKAIPSSNHSFSGIWRNVMPQETVGSVFNAPSP